jgi:hypothetical protein
MREGGALPCCRADLSSALATRDSGHGVGGKAGGDRGDGEAERGTPSGARRSCDDRACDEADEREDKEEEAADRDHAAGVANRRWRCLALGCRFRGRAARAGKRKGARIAPDALPLPSH